jgi:3-isopropylmalate/(R)-2-methylmalate dehydratase large subunit
MKTLIEKIWNAHVVKHISAELDVLYIDRHYLHEVTSPQAFESLRKRGLSVFRPKQCCATADHNVPTKDQHLPIEDALSAMQVQTLTENCALNNIELFGIGHAKQGIVHVIGPEQGKTLPGSTIVCGDSHTSTHGAFGTIAFGIGTSVVEHVLASQCLVAKRPKTMNIHLTGKLGPFATAKDVILYVISQLGSEGATGYFVEYTGEVIENMSMEGRMTVCNMSIEMGARGGLIGVDETTIAYLKQRTYATDAMLNHWRSFQSHSEGNFDAQFTFDAAEIQPMVTVGTSPDTGIRITEKISASKYISKASLNYMQFVADDAISSQSVDYVFIGSCTNGRIEDLRAAASLVNGRKKAPHVTVWVVPGSNAVKEQAISEGLETIFTNAGFEFRDPGCSACLAMNSDKIPSGALCVSTSNRNFEGRQGEGARTILASPLTAVASAIAGKVAHPSTLL